MPLPKKTRFAYRKIKPKNGKQRRQRLAFAPSNEVIEAKTQQKELGEWVDVKGNEKSRGYTRRL
jgi:hypothetical protein